MVLQGCRRRIGDEKDTHVWQVLWLPDRQNGCLTSAMPLELEHVTVNGLIKIDEQAWDEDVLVDLCNDRDWALIYQVPIPMRCKPDA